MTENEHLSAKEIEAAIEDHHRALAETLSELQHRLSLEGLLSGFGGGSLDHASALGKSLGDTARQHPAALALAGAALALLAHGTHHHKPAGPDQAPASSDPDAAKAPSAPPSSAAAMRAALLDGTEELAPEARARVVEARLHALDAQTEVEKDPGASQPEPGGGLLHDHPLLIGLIAAAAGAALGATLPRSREDWRALGERRDHLLSEAERILDREKALAMDLAKRAGDKATATAETLSERIRHPKE